MPGEPDLLDSMGVNPGGAAGNLGSRNYDYALKYRKDEPGTEGKGNARVWSVYLDEAENHDADIIQGYRNILDSLLIFAALFSGVVTAFVVQTSTTLQTDNAQVLIGLLYENNQLLRAAGNGTDLNAVPFAALAPRSPAHSSIDVWIVGLFFTSLVLALSTALLTVLAKQWVQMYTSIVPGDGKTRALIRQFRFEGIQTWQLGSIIEALPLILHGSMAVFLVGLSLHVLQLSTPICGVVASITGITFLFYFGTSLLPAIYTGCPYRVPSIFPMAQLVVFAFHVTQWGCLWGLKILGLIQVPRVDWPAIPTDANLKTTEYNTVFPNHGSSEESNGSTFLRTCQLACNTLYWLFEHSSNQSAKEIVAEGIAGLLNEWEAPLIDSIPSDGAPMVPRSSELLKHDIFPPTILISLDKMSTQPTSTMKDGLKNWRALTCVFSKAFSPSEFKSLVVGPADLCEQRQAQFFDSLKRAYLAADRGGDRVLSEHLLDLGGDKIFQPFEDSLEHTLLHQVAFQGSGEAIRSILKRERSIILQRDDDGWSALHHAAMGDNLDAINSCVSALKLGPSLLNLESNSSETPLDVALRFGFSKAVECLLAHGAKMPPNVLHRAVYAKDKELVKVLLEKGCEPAEKDEEGKTSIDIALNSLPEPEAVEVLTLLQRHTRVTGLNQT
ncbi:hypothetical protein DXG01_001582 [Tephrocybe rancida]|nr:hypothetical protein DXG01_001582 [Tephrocybe rancida]